MLSGSLPLPFRTVWVQKQAWPTPGNNSADLVLARGVTKLAGVYATFYRDIHAADEMKTPVTTLYGPHGPGAYQPDRDDIRSQLFLGARAWPVIPSRGYAEHWYRLRLSTGHYYGDNAVSILPLTYRYDSFMIGYDTETCALSAGGGLSMSGLSTKGGEPLRLSLQGFGLTAGQAPTSASILLYHDCILEMSVDSAILLD